MSNNNTVDRINTVTLQLRSDILHSSCGILIAYEVSKLPPISPNKKIKLSESPFHYNHPSSTAPMMVWIQSYDFHMEKARRRLKSLGYDSDNISFVPFSSKEAF